LFRRKTLVAEKKTKGDKKGRVNGQKNVRGKSDVADSEKKKFPISVEDIRDIKKPCCKRKKNREGRGRRCSTKMSL